jgi:hypothetical protein
MSKSIASHSLPAIHDIRRTDQDLGGSEVELNMFILVIGLFGVINNFCEMCFLSTWTRPKPVQRSSKDCTQTTLC